MVPLAPSAETSLSLTAKSSSWVCRKRRADQRNRKEPQTICHWVNSQFPYVISIPFYMGIGKWELAQWHMVCGFLPRLERRRSPELGLIYRNVCPYLAQHNRIASIEPRIRNAEGKLHAIDIAIIRVINLRGDAADWRIAKTQFAQEQAGLLIEKQRHQKPSGPGSLDNINHVSLAERDVLLQRRLAGWRRKIDNRRRRPTFHVRENLFDLSRKRQLGIESSSIQIAANQLKLTY